MDRSSHPFWKTYSTSPPVKYLRNEKYASYIHKINRFPKDLSKPFILDVENILHLSGYSRDFEKMLNFSEEIERVIELPECKAIIGATNGTLRDALKYIRNSKTLQDKFVKILPVIEVKPEKDFDLIADKPFTILCVGNKFWVKGIHIVIDVFKKLREQFGSEVKLVIACNDIPDDFPLCEGIDIKTSFQLTPKERDSLYEDAHIFLLPCFTDSFGVYLETLAYGLPLVGTKYYDKDEIVLDGITGYLFETPISLYDGNFGIDYRNYDEFVSLIKEKYKDGELQSLIDSLYFKISELIEDREQLKELSINSQKFCKEHLSIEKRNIAVNQLYDKHFS